MEVPKESSGIFLDASELLDKGQSLRRFSTGSKAVDGLIGGGIAQGQVVEVHGASNTGKTSLATRSVFYAALEGYSSTYVDTEGRFRPELFEHFAHQAGGEPQSLLRHVTYVRIDSSSEQMETIRMMGTRGPTMSSSLVVVDTLTRNFSLDLPGRANLSSRQGSLDVHLSEMARDAALNRRAYLLTNRVTFGPEHDVGIGGKTVSQMVSASIRLERVGGEVRATETATGRSVVLEPGTEGTI